MIPAKDDPVARLTKYWFRAQVMHDLLHSLMDEHGRDPDAIYKDHHAAWEFETYLRFWLSGLFVVVEGFNKLKLKDAKIQRLFKPHLRYLKAMRHETYHFVATKNPDAREVISQLNWAEELHAAIGNWLLQYHGERVATKRRAKAKRKKS